MHSAFEPIAELRARLREQRRSVGGEEAQQAARTAADRLLDLVELVGAGTVAAYIADDGELDPAPAVEQLRDASVGICAPRFSGDLMEFGLLTGEPRSGRFGLMEPAGESVPVAAIDVVVAPLVGVDLSGNRLGRGAGYYDRCLRNSQGPDRSERPLLVGFAYDFQIVAGLEPEPHDVPLAALITPTRILRFRS